MLDVFISHKFRANTAEARIVKRILKEFDLNGLILGGPDANPPWEAIRRKIRSSASLIAIFGEQESRKVHNELGMAWGNNIPCFALVENMADYDLGIASIVLSYGSRLDFRNISAFEAAVRDISRLVAKGLVQQKHDIENARRTLFSKLRREPSIPEVAAYLGAPVELVSQLVARKLTSDEYGKFGQYARWRRMQTDLSDAWKTLGFGGLKEIQTGKAGGIVYRSPVVRRDSWVCDFNFMVFSRKTSLVWWRNTLCMNHLEETHRSVIAFLYYYRESGAGFSSFMRSWGGDYSLLPNVEPGVHYFGPGEGYRNELPYGSKKRIDSLMTPTFVLDSVCNKEVLSERLKSLLQWMIQNRRMVFPPITWKR